MDCGATIVKYILFLFNILFVVCGILIVVFGSILVARIPDVGDAAQNFESNSIPVAIIVLGCVIFFISFLGCFGAIRENTSCTMAYSISVLVLFVAQIALIAFMWTRRAQFLNYMDQIVAKVWKEHDNDPEVMDGLQLAFNCCGQNGSTDYLFNLESIPNSCCGIDAKSCSIGEAIQKPGCAQAFNSFWNNNMSIIIYAGLIIAAIELVAFIFAWCLAHQEDGRVRVNIRTYMRLR